MNIWGNKPEKGLDLDIQFIDQPTWKGPISPFLRELAISSATDKQDITQPLNAVHIRFANQNVILHGTAIILKSSSSFKSPIIWKFESKPKCKIPTFSSNRHLQFPSLYENSSKSRKPLFFSTLIPEWNSNMLNSIEFERLARIQQLCPNSRKTH